MKREDLQKITCSLYLKIQGKLEAMDCHCIWKGGHRFEIEHHNDNFVMNLEESICGYKVWDLTSIACCHTITAIIYVWKEL